MDDLIEDFWVGESLVGEMMSLEVTPDHLDVIEFGRIFRQPLDGEPMGSLGERRQRRLADVDRPLSSTMTTGLIGIPGFMASGSLTPLQRVPRAASTEPLFCAAPWRAAIGRL
jgi:hypothetical protein